MVDLLDSRAAEHPDRIAWVFDLPERPRESLTYDEIARRSTHLAQALSERGVRTGDHVGVQLGNVPATGLVWFALMRLGAAIVPLNVRYRSTDRSHILDDAGVRLLVDDATYAELSAAAPQHPWREAPLDPETVVNVQYTSGTTGRPKGCLLTHRYWTTLGDSLISGHPHLDESDVLLTAQPFHYVDPQWNVVAALMAGARLVVLDAFHPSSFWAKVREHQVTYVYCLASMPVLLLRMPPAPTDRDHRVRVVQCSAIPPAVHAGLEERFGVPWFECFGMTETGADIRVGADEHDALVGSGCLGRPAAHRETRVDEAGQLWLRGPGMMLGYLGHPAPFDEDGWFPTGDLARTDDEGRLYLAGRLKDMIRRSGENIAAVEVEEVLLSHPAVQVAAVIGVPDEVRGEEVAAYVVAPGADEAELHAWCAERLAPFKVPSIWRFRDELPLTASLRVEKAALRREVAGAS
ncbi:AMP-binding protein [Nocardioides sp. CBS4Y-1]|uniref:AMP-binding protein n=1 Tax=Nocardioides acrostichi TaxID=2784339 RepID=A0A930UYE9_9ACTN|nr:AMP-binding protein [Nocardioides acrostichi]